MRYINLVLLTNLLTYRQTDRQTHDYGIYRASMASRSKTRHIDPFKSFEMPALYTVSRKFTAVCSSERILQIDQELTKL